MTRIAGGGREAGAWVLVGPLLQRLPRDRQPRNVGRKPTASPPTGSYDMHRREQAALVDEALRLDTPMSG